MIRFYINSSPISILTPYFNSMTRRKGCKQGRRSSTPHLVLFPCPLQGHLNPMLQLANLLASRGLSITIIHTKFNSPTPINHPKITLRPISDGLSEGEASNEDIMAVISALNINCDAPFRDCIEQMLKEKKIACLISDAIMHFTHGVAEHFNLPRIILRTSSATSFVTCAAFPLLREKGYLPITDPQSEKPVVELPPLRIKDLPNISSNDSETLYRLVEHMTNETRTSSGLIYNSFDYIEKTAFTSIQKDFPIPFFPIGPLYKYSSHSSSALQPYDNRCMAWLDKHAPKSVIYVSFGSLATIEKAELVEIAWGLANSKQPFLWVVRAGSVRNSKRVKLPEGFEERVGERGLVVKWAPQHEVLAHQAVGGFWTHNGWNSTLESICEGVPMLCMPCFGDQKLNARLVSHVWRVGLQLETELERGKIELAIRRLVLGKESDEMKERIKNLKENAGLCMRKGGSSYESLDRLINCILSF